MSLIQEALEKAGQAGTLEMPETKPKASPKPFPNKSQHPVHPIPVAAPKKEITESEKLVQKRREPKKSSSAKVLVAIFGIAVLVIAGAACFILASQMTKSWEKSVNPATVQSTQGAVQKEPSSLGAVQEGSLVIKYDEQFHLSGITNSGTGEPLALINNQVLGVGDSLREGVIVHEIENRKVILLQNGNREIILRF